MRDVITYCTKCKCRTRHYRDEIFGFRVCKECENIYTRREAITMKLHPVLLKDGRVVADRRCGFCMGFGLHKNEICHCLVMYYGQPPSRRVVEDLKEQLKKFNAEGRYASRRKS